MKALTPMWSTCEHAVTIMCPVLPAVVCWSPGVSLGPCGRGSGGGRAGTARQSHRGTTAAAPLPVVESSSECTEDHSHLFYVLPQRADGPSDEEKND